MISAEASLYINKLREVRKVIVAIKDRTEDEIRKSISNADYELLTAIHQLEGLIDIKDGSETKRRKNPNSFF